MEVRSKLERVGVLAILVAIVVSALELFSSRVLGLGSPPLTVLDSDAEYMFKPNQDVMRFGKRQKYNQFGMRSDDLPSRWPTKEERRVLVLGDSVINGGSLTGHDELATSILEEQLSIETGGVVRVLNMSAGSWGPPNVLAFLEKYGCFGAALVVVQVSSHDIDRELLFRPLSTKTHPRENPPSAAMELFIRYLPRYIPPLEGLSREVETSESLGRSLSALRIAGLGALDVMDEIKAVVEKQGAELRVLLHAEAAEASDGKYKEGGAAFMRWASGRAIPLHSLLGGQSEALASGSEIYRDPIHLSVEGQRWLAKEIGPFIGQGLDLATRGSR